MASLKENDESGNTVSSLKENDVSRNTVASLKEGDVSTNTVASLKENDESGNTVSGLKENDESVSEQAGETREEPKNDELTTTRTEDSSTRSKEDKASPNPTTKEVTKPTTKEATNPTTKEATKPATKPTTKEVTKPTTKEVTKPTRKQQTPKLTDPPTTLSNTVTDNQTNNEVEDENHTESKMTTVKNRMQTYQTTDKGRNANLKKDKETSEEENKGTSPKVEDKAKKDDDKQKDSKGRESAKEENADDENEEEEDLSKPEAVREQSKGEILKRGWNLFLDGLYHNSNKLVLNIFVFIKLGFRVLSLITLPLLIIGNQTSRSTYIKPFKVIILLQFLFSLGITIYYAIVSTDVSSNSKTRRTQFSTTTNFVLHPFRRSAPTTEMSKIGFQSISRTPMNKPVNEWPKSIF